MGVLFRRSKFFIDLKTMLAYTDLYVTERLIEYGTENNLDLSLFTTLIPEYESLGPQLMKERLQAKHEVNVLLSYINWDEVCMQESADPVGFCNELYNSLLYQEFEWGGETSPKLIMTPLADTIQLITKDSNTEEINIYMEDECRYLELIISEFMRSDKIKFIHGDKKEFLSKNEFDSYFFENVDDLEYICHRHKQRAEVIIPTFPFNVCGYDIDTNGDPVYSQDSFMKTTIFSKSPIECLVEYNFDIALIDIPL